jgi:hypothetical protein
MLYPSIPDLFILTAYVSAICQVDKKGVSEMGILCLSGGWVLVKKVVAGKIFDGMRDSIEPPQARILA